MKSEKLVPNIRFKGFTNTWEKQQFSDIVYKSGERNVHSFPLESYSVSNKDGFISQKEQFKYGGIVTIADKSKSLIITPQTFAYNPARLDVGSIGYWNGSVSVLISPMYEVFKVYEDVVDAYFLWYWLKSDLFNRIVNLNQEGGVRTCFKFPTLLEKYILMPKDLEEQNKVSNLIILIDSLLTFYKRKSEKLENLKKSLLEKMFVSDGEQFPAIRFKGFTNTWEKKKLSDISQIIVGKVVTKKETNENGNYPIISGGIEPLGYLNKYNQVKDTVTVGRAGSAGNVQYQDTNFWLNDKCFALKSNSSTNDYFLYSMLLKYQNDIQNLVTIGTLPVLNSTKLKSLKLKFTATQEQKEIAEFFKALNELLTLHKRKCEKLENIKQFLLEKMFC
ncbi:restriction endonuclease subunit S [Mycoplasma sp. VS1572C]